MNKTLIQIVKNMMTSWGVVGLQAAIGLYMVPFLLGHLGKEGYGVVGILISVVGFAEVADLGLRSALNRELSEKVANKDDAGFRFLSSSALSLYLAISLVLGIAVWFMAPWICTIFNVIEQYRELTILLLRTYGVVSVVLSFVIPVFSAGICSFMRYDIQNNINMFSKVFVSLLLFLFLTLVQVNPLIIWCLMMGVGEVVRLMILIVYYRRTCFGGKISFRFVKLKELVPLFRLGGSMYLLQLTRVMALRADPLIISHFLGLGAVALYQAGSRLPQLVNPIVLALANQLTPITTKLHVSKNQSREQEVLIMATKYTLYLGTFFSASMILFADSFCYLWLFNKLGDDVKMVALVLKMWAVANLFNSVGGAQWTVLLGKKALRFSILLNLPLAIFNVILSVFLVGFTDMGVIGVLVGTVISSIIRRPIMSWYISKLTRLSFRRYITDAYVFPLFFFALLLLLGNRIYSGQLAENWGVLLGSIGLISLTGGILFMGFEWRNLVRICLYSSRSRSV